MRPNGLNTYAAYHVMWGGLDPSGEVGIFFDGAGQNLKAKTIIGDLFNAYNGKAYRYYTRIWPNNIIANIEKAWQRVAEEYCKKATINCDTGGYIDERERVDIFGWSRGGVAALELASLLNDHGVRCWTNCCGKKKIVRIRPVKVTFLGLIDVVSRGGAQMAALNDDEVPHNVMRSTHHRRASNNLSDFDGTVFNRINVTANNGVNFQFTTHTQHNHNTSHADSGWPNAGHTIKKDIEAEAKKAGVPLR